MRILLTGASSFTGYWFARELSAAAHEVVAPLRGAAKDYLGVRGERVKRLAAVAEVIWASPFGEANFLALARTRSFDLLCHHAARITDYRSPDFDVVAALAENTRSLPALLRVLGEKGLRGMVLTGTVFEADEGAGSPPLRAFSPYGVSKGITAAVVRYWCEQLGVPLGKFVIPNPFGPFEEARFCSYLVNTWKAGKVAEVRTPHYVRDNIHAGLLAKIYVEFVAATAGASGFRKRNPSGYVGTQATFAERCARELGPRLGLKAELKLVEQTDFSEPMERVNTEPVDGARYGWSERAAWDEMAEYYR